MSNSGQLWVVPHLALTLEQQSHMHRAGCSSHQLLHCGCMQVGLGHEYPPRTGNIHSSECVHMVHWGLVKEKSCCGELSCFC